jgi:WD40 repeat protein
VRQCSLSGRSVLPPDTQGSPAPDHSSVKRLLSLAGLVMTVLSLGVVTEVGARSLPSRPPPAPLFAGFTSDGTRIVTGGVFVGARIWDVGSGQLLHTFGSFSGLQTVALSRDGTRVVTTYGDGGVRVWDSGSGRLLRTVKRNQVGYDWGSGETLSPDNRLLVTSSGGADRLRIWDMTSGRRLATVNCADGPAVFSRDGRQMVACGDAAVLWDVGANRIRRRLNTGDWVNASAFSPDGRLLVTAGYDTTLWNVATGRKKQSLQSGYEVSWAVAFSPNGRLLVVAGARDYEGVGAGAHVWDMLTGRRVYALRGHADRVNAAAFNADGTRILTVADDGTARIWDAANGRNLRVLRDPAGIGAAAFSPDGSRLLTLSIKGVPTVRNADGAHVLRRYVP